MAEGVATRQSIYITSKLSPFEMGTAAATAACTNMLHRLDLGYVDLVLIHWPAAAKTDLRSPIHATRRLETWRVLEEFHSQGHFKAIGVSNFEISHLEGLLPHTKVLPAVNQIECHPAWPQEELRQWCHAHGIAVVAYASFGTGTLLQPGVAAEVETVAERTGQTAAQVLLRWGLQKECAAVLPKSVRPERIAEFAHIAAVAEGVAAAGAQERWLSEADEALIDSLAASEQRRRKYCWDPSTVL